jgi:hypothetical protein
MVIKIVERKRLIFIDKAIPLIPKARYFEMNTAKGTAIIICINEIIKFNLILPTPLMKCINIV